MSDKQRKYPRLYPHVHYISLSRALDFNFFSAATSQPQLRARRFLENIFATMVAFACLCRRFFSSFKMLRKDIVCKTGAILRAGEDNGRKSCFLFFFLHHHRAR